MIKFSESPTLQLIVLILIIFAILGIMSLIIRQRTNIEKTKKIATVLSVIGFSAVVLLPVFIGIMMIWVWLHGF